MVAFGAVGTGELVVVVVVFGGDAVVGTPVVGVFVVGSGVVVRTTTTGTPVVVGGAGVVGGGVMVSLKVALAVGVTDSEALVEVDWEDERVLVSVSVGTAEAVTVCVVTARITSLPRSHSSRSSGVFVAVETNVRPRWLRKGPPSTKSFDPKIVVTKPFNTLRKAF